MIPLDERALRQQALRLRAQLSDEQRSQGSRQIADKLMEYLRDAHTIALYLADETEVDLRMVLEELWETKTIAVPVCTAGGHMCMNVLTKDVPLVKNRYGIEEPAQHRSLPAAAFDVIVVPIVAFDARGNRLGHGMGYYDRYLAMSNACKIGVAFDCQEMAHIVRKPHDIAMDLILTPSAVYDFRQGDVR